MKRLTLLGFFVAVVVCGQTSTTVAGEKYRNEEHGFTVELPDRWVSVSPTVVTQINSVIERFLNANISYLTCFVPAGRTSSELPRIFVQFQPWDGGIPTYEALEEDLKTELDKAVGKVKKEAGIPLHSLNLGDVILDRKENRLQMRMQAIVPGEGSVHALSIGMMGKSGVVFLHCYARADKFARTVPLFEVFADSFRYDEGRAYDPAEATVTESTRSSRGSYMGFSLPGASHGGLIGALIGGGLGAVVWAVRKARRRFG
jgi:hypothetical protein